VYRKNLAHLLVESLLRLPSLVQLRASRPFLRSLSDAQASMVVYGVVALKWLSLSVLEATLPRVLQVQATQTNTTGGLVSQTYIC
jgi:hypothetical protein